MKAPFYKVFKSARLNEQEASSLICAVESQINSRPIAPMSTSTDDLDTIHITPGHLLIGKPIQHLPSHFENASYSSNATQVNVRQRWKRRRALELQYMSAFRKEYVLLLRQLTKNYTKERPLKVGDLCIITTEQSTYNKYPLGVVHKILLGRDDLPRTVQVRLQQPAHLIDGKGRHKSAPTIITRGVECLLLLEEALSTE